MIDMANDFKPQLIPTSIIKNKPQSSVGISVIYIF
jgi:hypothetical protein